MVVIGCIPLSKQEEMEVVVGQNSEPIK